jgi:hypothetical protein
MNLYYIAFVTSPAKNKKTVLDDRGDIYCILWHPSYASIQHFTFTMQERDLG